MKKILSTALIYLATALITQVHADIKFPDNFERLLTLPAKRDTIEIPMPVSTYESYLKQIKIFNDAIIKEEFNDSTVNVTLETKNLNAQLMISDENKRYTYFYHFIDSYLLSISISINYQSDDTEQEKDLIKNKIFDYLTERGFVKSQDFIDKLSRGQFYVKDNVRVYVIDHIGRFLIEISNKDLEDNEEKIEKEVAQKKLKETRKLMNEILN